MSAERTNAAISVRRVVDLVRDEEWVLAARREAEFAERDGYETTAALLRGCADEIESRRKEVADLKKRLGYPEFAR